MPDVVSDNWVEPASQRSLYDYGSTGKEDNGTEDNTHDEPVSRMTSNASGGVPIAREPTYDESMPMSMSKFVPVERFPLFDVPLERPPYLAASPSR